MTAHSVETAWRSDFAIERADEALGGAQKLLQEVGSTGLRRGGGVILEEFLPALQGVQGRRVYREMVDNDPVVGAGVTTVDLTMRQVEWDLEPADESPAALEVSDFVESCMHDMEDTWADVLSAAMSFLPYGWSLLEEVYKYRRGDQGGQLTDGTPVASSRHDDGKLGWRNLAIRSQDSLLDWAYDPTDTYIVGMRQQDPVKGAFTIPMMKALHFRTSALKANPEGRSILRNSYRPWWYKRRIEEYEAIGIERDMAGIPIVGAPVELFDVNASPSEKALLAALQELATKVRRNENEGIVFPIEYFQNDDGTLSANLKYTFGLLSSQARKLYDIGAAIARYDQRIVMTMMADFILLGHEGVAGGLGVTIGQTKVDLFTAALDAWLTQITEEFNTTAIPRLVKYNGWPVELAPKLRHGRVQGVDLEQLAGFVKGLADAGFAIGGFDQVLRYLLMQAELPTEDLDLMIAAAAPGETGVASKLNQAAALGLGQPGAQPGDQQQQGSTDGGGMEAEPGGGDGAPAGGGQSASA